MPGAPFRRRDALRRDGVGVVRVQCDKGQGQERERDSGRSFGSRVGPSRYYHVSNEVHLRREPGTFVADLVNSLESYPPKFECSITPRDKLAEDLIRASALA